MTMRARTVIIWLCVILIGVPVALLVFDDLAILTDNATVVASVVLILSLTVAGWRLKRRLKERMERGLGREVDDSELTSITAWMRIPDEAARAGREAEKFDFRRLMGEERGASRVALCRGSGLGLLAGQSGNYWVVVKRFL